MRNFIVYLLFFGSFFTLKAQPGFGQATRINNSWKFLLADPEGVSKTDFNDQKWQEVTLPHDWSVRGQLSPDLASCTGFLPGGIAWYRKSLNIPQEKSGQKVFLYFEGVYNRSEVFVNGVAVGNRPNGYVSFMYDITPFVNFGKENQVAVRVDHSRSADSRWYAGSGIYRDVWLVYANPVHIAQWGVYAVPQVKSTQEASLQIQVELNNESMNAAGLTVLNELYAPDGKLVSKSQSKIALDAGKQSTVKSVLKVKNPQLWNLDNPKLYTLKTKVLSKGKQIDESTVITGFRTFTFNPDKGFALNGKSMKMKGVCLHHDAGVLGAASYKAVWKRRLLNLKEIGVNAIRTSHNPQASHLYELCDELGILVMNEAFDEWEFPKRKWMEGWNVGTPGFQGSFDFFEAWGEKDLEEMVRRDRNHLSVFAWSIGNEVDYPNDPYSHPVLNGGSENGFTQPVYGGYKKDAPDAMRLGAIAKKLAAVVRKFDPSRAVTAGLAGVAMSNETEYPGTLDICGYNYTESKYDSDHKKYPQRVIYGSENGHSFDAWKQVRDKAFIFGQFIWTGNDYLGESGRWPSRGFYSGLLDFGGFIKPRGYFRQAMWSEKPVIYLGTYPKRNDREVSQDAWSVWNYENGTTIRVVCYMNTASATLYLNGKVVGENKKYDDNSGIIFWDIPYQDGKLEVEGLDNQNKISAKYAIETTGRPNAIVIKHQDKSISKENGIAQIEVQIVDEKGLPVMVSDDEITCRIQGTAELMGMEAGNNEDMGDYTDNKQRVYHGKMLIYLRGKGEAGQVKVKLTSPWLKVAETSLEVL
jgi:beta-galactosidase/beta-glucuronidase